MSFLLLISLFTNWTAFWEPLGIAIIAALNSASRWKQHRGLQGGQSPLPCTHVSGACKKQPCFKENWMDFPKMLAFNSEFALAFVIQPFKVKFVFLNANFSKYSWAEQQPWFKYQQRDKRVKLFHTRILWLRLTCTMLKWAKPVHKIPETFLVSLLFFIHECSDETSTLTKYRACHGFYGVSYGNNNYLSAENAHHICACPNMQIILSHTSCTIHEFPTSNWDTWQSMSALCSMLALNQSKYRILKGNIYLCAQSQ